MGCHACWHEHTICGIAARTDTVKVPRERHPYWQHWTPRGAHPLLETRTQVLNNELL